MKREELKVIRDFYELMLYFTQRIEKYPRQHRYSLGRDMEARLQIILALLIEAKYSKEKAVLLRKANIELETLRFQTRLAHDLKALPYKSHEHSMKQLLHVGAQVGGWLRGK